MTRPYLFLALLPALTGTAMATPSRPTINPIWNHTKPVKSRDQPTLSSVNRLMTRLSLASQALLSKNASAAKSDLMDASVLVRSLEKSRPEIVSNYQAVYGKTHYTYNNMQRDYYVPVADDLALQRVYASSEHRGNAEVKLRRADVVETTVQLNLKSVAAAVRGAQSSLSSGKYGAAELALSGIFKNSLTSQVVVTDPLSRVWANLNMAQDFLSQRDYPSARFSLEAARVDLDRLENSKALARNSSDARVFRGDLVSLQKQLNEASISPTASQSIRARLHAWAVKMKKWA
jgi:hypothetical protein